MISEGVRYHSRLCSKYADAPVMRNPVAPVVTTPAQKLLKRFAPTTGSIMTSVETRSVTLVSPSARTRIRARGRTRASRRREKDASRAEARGRRGREDGGRGAAHAATRAGRVAVAKGDGKRHFVWGSGRRTEAD